MIFIPLKSSNSQKMHYVLYVHVSKNLFKFSRRLEAWKTAFAHLAIWHTPEKLWLTLRVLSHEALRLDLGCIRSLYNQSTSLLTDNGKLTAEERTWHLFSFPAAKNRTITYVGQIIKCLEDDILGVQFYRTVSRTERTFRKDSESTEFVYHGEYELVLQLPPRWDREQRPHKIQTLCLLRRNKHSLKVLRRAIIVKMCYFY